MRLEQLQNSHSGVNMYEPFFPLQQKAINEGKKIEDRRSEIFDSKTDNDYLSIIEAKRHRYISDKVKLQDLQKIIEILLDMSEFDPDRYISQEKLQQLVQMGVIDHN